MLMAMQIRLFLLISLLLILIPSAPARTLKIATLSPEGSHWMKLMRQAAQEVSEQTQHRVKIKYYPGGVMGSDKVVLRKIRAGQLQGAAITSGSLVSYYPDSIIYNMPAEFNSYAEIDHLRSTFDPIIMAGLRQKGLVTFGLVETGFAYMMSKKPIRSLSDLHKAKMWVPDNDSSAQEIVAAFGLNPITLPLGDVLAGLQTGLVDTVAISPIGALILQWQSQVHYVTNLPLFYLYGTLIMQEKAYLKLQQSDQEVLQQVFAAKMTEADHLTRQDNQAALEALRAQGLQFIQPSPEDIKSFHDGSRQYTNSLISEQKLSQDLFNQLKASLQEYRSHAK